MTRSFQRSHRLSWMLCAYALPSLLLGGCQGKIELGEVAPANPVLSKLLPSDAVRPMHLVRSPEVPAPLTGNTLRISRDGTLAVVLEPTESAVHIVDLEAKAVRTTVMLEPQAEPRRVIEDSRGNFHILERGTGWVRSMNRSGRFLASQPVCAELSGATTYDQNGEEVLKVVCRDGKIVTLTTVGLRPVSVVEIPEKDDLRDVISSGSNLFISRLRSAEVFSIDGTGNLRASVRLPMYRLPSVSGDFEPHVAWRLLPLPDGSGGALLINQAHATALLGTGWCPNPAICPEPTVHLLTHLDADLKIVKTTRLTQAPLPIDMAISAKSGQIIVLAAGNFTSPLMGSAPPPGRSLLTGSLVELDKGQSLSGLPTSPPPTFKLSAIDVRGEEWVLQERERRSIYIGTGKTNNWIEIPLVRAAARPNAGFDLFHAVTPIGTACASCHAEGGDDGLVVQRRIDSNIVSRRTLPLYTGLDKSAPYHSNGDEKDLASLIVSDLAAQRLSGVKTEDPAVTELTRWVLGLRPPWMPVFDQADQSLVQKGQNVFNAQGCARCHDPGRGFSSPMSVRVHEKDPELQVPALVGMPWRAPYLHSGCAKTIQEIFNGTCAKEGLGGNGVHDLSKVGVSDSDLDALSAYLRSQ